jgi:hypothetical protein
VERWRQLDLLVAFVAGAALAFLLVHAVNPPGPILGHVVVPQRLIPHPIPPQKREEPA